MPTAARNAEELVERIRARVTVTESNCWEWQGSRKPNGYGEMTVGQKRKYAHRVSYEVHGGVIPNGMYLDHLCRNVCCVNPAHLEPVTPQENTMRGLAPDAQRRRFAVITHCPKGHPYDVTNTYRTKAGTRQCKACNLQRSRERRAKSRAAR